MLDFGLKIWEGLLDWVRTDCLTKARRKDCGLAGGRVIIKGGFSVGDRG